MGVENDQNFTKTGHKKSRRFVIFSVAFWRILVQKWSIGIYRKTGPTKSTVLGPRPPPPGKSINFIDFYRFFTFLGSSIEPEKPSPKSASTANPPQNDHFIRIFNLSRPNFVPIPFIWSLPISILWIYRSFINDHWRKNPTVFLFFDSDVRAVRNHSCIRIIRQLLAAVQTKGATWRTGPPKRPSIQAQTQEQAIIRDPI
jgi:hypothetical protein